MFAYHLNNGGEYEAYMSTTLYSQFQLSQAEFENMVKDAMQIVGNDIFKVATFLENEYEYFEEIKTIAFATVDE